MKLTYRSTTLLDKQNNKFCELMTVQQSYMEVTLWLISAEHKRQTLHCKECQWVYYRTQELTII